MRSTKSIKTAKIGYIAMSLVFCAVGIFLLVFPEATINLAGILAAILVIAFGIIKIIGYFSRDLYRLAFQYDLAFGILLIVLGILILTKPSSLMHLLCIALGFAIAVDGLFKIQISLDSKRFGIRNWWAILLFAALACGIGLFLVFRPSTGTEALIIFTGILLLVDGILNLLVAVFTVKITDNQQPDYIEVDAELDKESHSSRKKYS